MVNGGSSVSSSSGGGDGRVRQRAGQLEDEVVEATHRARVGRVDRVVGDIGREEDVLDQVEPLAVVVERGDVPGQRQHRVGPADRVVGHVRQALDLAHHVVAEVPDDATVERRELGQPRAAEPGEQRFERGQRTLVEWHVGRDVADGLDLVAAHDERQRGVATDEREAAPVLAVLDRLEQEALAVADQLHERRDRRLEVGQDLAPDRHDGVVPRERAELVE